MHGSRAAPICERVNEWALAAGGIEPEVILPERHITRRPPRTVEPQIDVQYTERLDAVIREKYLVPIDGARLRGTSGLMLLPDGSVSSESLYNRAVLEGDPDYLDPPPRPLVEKRGNYFSLIVTWSKSWNYYHWLHDTLEQLVGVIERLPADARYIVPANLNPLQRETLRLVGIRDAQLEPYAGDEEWVLETMWFSNATTNSGSARREADTWLRDTVMSAYGLTSSGGRRRLFVSRRKASQRRVANERSVRRLLDRRGFETVVPEELSFRQQVEVFSEAAVVVSNHGAAFTNIVFAPPGLVVVDMIEPLMMRNGYIFWTIADELGHEYWYLCAESVRRPRRSQPDTLVPVDRLAATLDRAGF